MATIINAQIRQDAANWGAIGQLVKQTSSWIWFGVEDFDDSDIHDGSIAESGTADGGSATQLEDLSKSWTLDEWAGYLVRITGGTNVDDVAKITGNTADVLTVDAPWIVTVDNTSQYEISLAGRITIPEDGIYEITPRLTFSADASRLYGIFIYVNNVFYNSIFTPGITVESAVVMPTETIPLSAGDYVEIKGYNGGPGEQELISFGRRNKVTVKKIGN